MTSPLPPKPPDSLAHDGTIFVRGLLMGGADVIPGVSGGTIALIVGIYQRLVVAVSQVDGTLLGHVCGGRWRAAAGYIDLRFLAVLVAGIFAGIVGLGSLMSWLLAEGSATRAPTLAAFFGAILASSVLVGRMIRPRSSSHVAVVVGLGIAGSVFAWWLTGLPAMEKVAGPPHPLYLFSCSVVAICAMILPGISGAYMLLIFGLYEYMLGVLAALTRGQFTGANVLAVVLFAAGCAVGLITFSKVLRWLLAKWQPETMAVLCGFMDLAPDRLAAGGG
jgi:putative membrane protein